MSILWKSVATGTRGPESLRGWRDEETRRHQERVDVVSAEMSTDPTGCASNDDALIHKMLRKLENG